MIQQDQSHSGLTEPRRIALGSRSSPYHHPICAAQASLAHHAHFYLVNIDGYTTPVVTPRRLKSHLARPSGGSDLGNMLFVQVELFPRYAVELSFRKWHCASDHEFRGRRKAHDGELYANSDSLAYVNIHSRSSVRSYRAPIGANAFYFGLAVCGYRSGFCRVSNARLRHCTTTMAFGRLLRGSGRTVPRRFS